MLKSHRSSAGQRSSWWTGFPTLFRRDDRAATLAFTAVALSVLLGSTALAVDLGMLITARVQSQRAADSGALAGAQRLAMSGATEADAREEAKEFANQHEVLTKAVAVEDADVDVAGDTVRVRVGHSITTLFARIFGVDAVPVSTVAAAEAVPAGGAACPLPIVAVDGWDDADGDGLYDTGEYYEQCTGENAATCTGYNLTDDVGLRMEVKSTNTSTPGDGSVMTCGAENPSWYCWIDATENGGLGKTEQEDALRGCETIELSLSIGDTVWSSSGNRQSLAQDAYQYINDNDPDQYWSTTQPCVSDAAGCVESSLRVRPLAIVDPTTIEGSGSGSRAVINNMASAFMEKVATDDTKAHGQDPPPGQWNLYVRLNGSAQDGLGRGGAAGQLQQVVVLIE